MDESNSIPQVIEKKFPLLMVVVVVYTIFEFIDQLFKLPNFTTLTSIANITADLFLILTIIIPLIILYGIFKRKPWGRILTLVWFGLEGIFALFGIVFIIIRGALAFVEPGLIIEFLFYVFIWVYVYREKAFFA